VVGSDERLWSSDVRRHPRVATEQHFERDERADPVLSSGGDVGANLCEMLGSVVTVEAAADLLEL
jgi:hypothetical protein